METTAFDCPGVPLYGAGGLSCLDQPMLKAVSFDNQAREEQGQLKGLCSKERAGALVYSTSTLPLMNGILQVSARLLGPLPFTALHELKRAESDEIRR